MEAGEQLTLFPELELKPAAEPISALPGFEKALENFIRIADLGAFIQLRISGLEKSYSVSTLELKISDSFLAGRHQVSPKFRLFPAGIRQGINRIKYEVKSFFNQNNSLPTPIGYFLLRSYFPLWEQHLKNCCRSLELFLQRELGQNGYKRLFMKTLKTGYDFIFTIMKPDIPYQFRTVLEYEEIIPLRKQLRESGITLSKLPRDDGDFIFKCLILKTLHIPATLKDYLKGIHFGSILKSVHLEYLKDMEIESLEDIKLLAERLEHDETHS